MTETPVPFTVADGRQRHARYAELVSTAPVHRIVLPTGEQAWLITRYDDARHALQDPRLVKGEMTMANGGRGLLPPEVFAAMATHMLNLNPPDHTRLRRLVMAVFTRRRVEQLAPRVQQITDELLDAMDDATQIDLISSFAYLLPVIVICELLGVPANRRAEFQQWCSIAVAGVLAGADTLVTAITSLVSSLRELVEAKRAAPGDDLLSALVAVRDGEDRLSEDELISMAYLILVAGHETTVHLIGNGILALLTQPEQLALLRSQPHLLPTAVEEVLRFNGPLQVATFRWTREAIQIGGITIPAGEIVLVGLLAANRDPMSTSGPDVLDITRTDNPHLSFGHGIHYCLGASLGRLETRIALSSLFTRFPRLQLTMPAEQLTYQPSVLINGLTALPVLLR